MRQSLLWLLPYFTWTSLHGPSSPDLPRSLSHSSYLPRCSISVLPQSQWQAQYHVPSQTTWIWVSPSLTEEWYQILIFYKISMCNGLKMWKPKQNWFMVNNLRSTASARPALLFVLCLYVARKYRQDAIQFGCGARDFAFLVRSQPC